MVVSCFKMMQKETKFEPTHLVTSVYGLARIVPFQPNLDDGLLMLVRVYRTF